jgi:D-3-phosphoglycerate dehydrogenase
MEDEERGILAPLNAKIIEIEGSSDEEISKAAENADAIMVVSSYIRTSVFHVMKNCRIISRMGTGYDKIDVEQAMRQGIMVTNIPDFCTDEVADHTMALLLASARRIKEYDLIMRTGKRPAGPDGIHRLSVQTAGLVGFGRIGCAVARRCHGFGLKVLAYDPSLTSEKAAKEGVVSVPLNQLLEESDYVCLLCPLLPSTRKMIAMQQLKMMKKTAVLVNTGRGELVDEEDLVIALRTGIIRFAALDVFAGINVFAQGGFSTDHPFFDLENVLLTPHVSAGSEESLADARRRGAQAVVDVLNGKLPLHLVNPEVRPWFQIERPK